QTSPYNSRPTNTVTVTIRNAMMAGAEKRNDSRPEAESRRASTVPATTTTAPRSASLRRQRFRTRRITSISSVRWSMSVGPPRKRLQEFLLAREVIRDHRFGRQESHARQQQIPPQ